jgi:hypothetical protein
MAQWNSRPRLTPRDGLAGRPGGGEGGPGRGIATYDPWLGTDVRGVGVTRIGAKVLHCDIVWLGICLHGVLISDMKHLVPTMSTLEGMLG